MRVFLLFFSNSYQSSTLKAFFLYCCPYPNQSPTKKGVILFFPFLSKALPKRMFYSILALTLAKALSQRVFSLFCPYFNQTPTKKSFFFSVFALALTKALPKRVFFFMFALISTKTLQKRGVFSILPLF